VLAAVGAAAAPLAAQSFELGIGAAFHGGYPEPFKELYCDGNRAGIGASAAWHALRWVSLEATSTYTTDTDGTYCAPDILAPTQLDTEITETRFDEGVRGGSYFASHLSALLEPWRQASVSPRARIGVGRIWSKDLSDWQWGLGVRYRFGRHSMVTNIDWWKVDVPETVELVIYPSTGGRQVLDSERIVRSYQPFTVRVGWELSVGR